MQCCMEIGNELISRMCMHMNVSPACIINGYTLATDDCLRHSRESLRGDKNQRYLFWSVRINVYIRLDNDWTHK